MEDQVRWTFRAEPPWLTPTGCSSLEGFLQENGKFQWAWGQFKPTINQYSWVNLTNMLWYFSSLWMADFASG
jgi:hypothetical protein